MFLKKQLTAVWLMPVVAGLVAALIFGSADSTTSSKGNSMDNIAIKFLTLLEERKAQEAFDLYVGPTYIQHNPMFPDGKEATIKMLNSMPADITIKHGFKRVLVDGNLIAVHSSLEVGKGPAFATVDIFRLESGKIVEHWDVAQQVPEKSMNNNTMF